MKHIEKLDTLVKTESKAFYSRADSRDIEHLTSKINELVEAVNESDDKDTVLSDIAGEIRGMQGKYDNPDDALDDVLQVIEKAKKNL